MKIVHLVGEAGAGGAELHALELARAQRDRGDDVTVVHVHGGPDAATVPVRSAPTASEVRAALDDLSPDVLHVHGTPLPPGSEPLTGPPAVIRSLHDYTFGCAAGEHWFRNGAACRRAHGARCVEGILIRGCAHRADVRPALRALAAVPRRLAALRGAQVVVYSRHMEDVAVANRVAPESVHVLRYFVARRDRPAPPVTGRIFAFVGRVVGAKGLDIALQALARCTTSWDEFHVVGDGWARIEAERLAASLGIADRVRFHGWLPRKEAASVLGSSTALILPSRWPEPVGIAGLEAGAVGRPVIGSNTGGIPEWLRSGENGLLVRPGDIAQLAEAITALASDDKLAARLGRGGWLAAEAYGAESHLASLDEVYAEAQRRAAA